jgi:hypothetical protein
MNTEFPLLKRSSISRAFTFLENSISEPPNQAQKDKWEDFVSFHNIHFLMVG